MRKVEDRRVRRTRAALQDALVALMIEKGYEATSVQDIIDRANVGRATFYSHFADKRTLLVSRLEDLRAHLVDRQREAMSGVPRGSRQFGFSIAMLEHAASSLALWKSISNSEGGAFVMRRIHDMVADLVRNDLSALGMNRPSSQREMLVQQITGSFMGAMMWWLEEGAKLSPREVDEAFRRVVMDGLGDELRARSKGSR